MLKEKLDECVAEIVNEFVLRYKVSFPELDDSVYSELERVIRKIIDATLEVNEKELTQSCKELAQINFDNEIPYVMVLNELNGLKTLLTNELLQKNAKDEIYELHQIYNDVENVVAYEHLSNYMERLLHANNVRINSLKDLMRKNLISHYQAHLEWLSGLTQAIKVRDTALIPQLDAHACNFGKWLDSEGKSVISNNPKYKLIVSIHKNLHSLASAIKQLMEKKYVNFNVLMSYLEKCEFISLAIGTELALIDNRLLINESSKDKMTGALNRNSLEPIFINQYELALATDTTFIFALCDLDHFKRLNDTHGHLAGDFVLKEFVQMSKSILRDSDIIVRYGGEEFVVILPNSDLVNGEKKLNQLRENFKNLCCTQNGEHLDVSVSIGATIVNPDQEIKKSEIDIETFIKQADEKLYGAKHGGRDRVVI
jgi:diguanylate cyclase (GGDEF)-like protein